jgi:ferredoxin
MTYIITSLCLRDGSCVEVCPVECIVPGKPKDQWPWFYIDPDTCIDCGACIPECPYEAIFTEDEVPANYEAKGGERQSMPVGTPGFEQSFLAHNEAGIEVNIPATRELEPGQSVDLTEDIPANYDFFTKGAGYWEGWEKGVTVDDPESVAEE